MRYAINGDTIISNEKSFDVIVIGAGLAGMYTALHIDSRYSCCIITKEGVDLSNSWLAQGGIAAAVNIDDTPKFHFEDTLIAGAELCDKAAVKVLVDEGPDDIRNLVKMKVPFDLNSEGDLMTTREGGHRHNRVVHAGGDATGRETVKALSVHVLNRPNIYCLTYTFCVDLLTDLNGSVCGIITRDMDDKYTLIKASNVVIATGGIGQVYETSTNPFVATGDGLAIAMRAGAELKDIEFVQFHPTGLYSESGDKRAFLISEALRGEGALLKSRSGERFMENAHELKELAPRDIVAREILKELEKSGDTNVFLDITSKDEDFLKKRFPTIYNECLRRGINISKDLIPVVPVQHYMMGGIKTDLYARTNIPRLYACGEAACTGVHGANRLASNSMLECLVFGRRAAFVINGELDKKNVGTEALLPELPVRPLIEWDFEAKRAELQHLMNTYCGAMRSVSGLKRAESVVCAMLSELREAYNPSKDYLEMLNLTEISYAIIKAAQSRTESVGAHYMVNDQCDA